MSKCFPSFLKLHCKNEMIPLFCICIEDTALLLVHYSELNNNQEEAGEISWIHNEERVSVELNTYRTY